MGAKKGLKLQDVNFLWLYHAFISLLLCKFHT